MSVATARPPLSDTEKLQRALRAMLEGRTYTYLPASGPWYVAERAGVWYVHNPATHETYDVTEAACTCPDYIHRCARDRARCKHLIALRMHRRRLQRALPRLLGGAL